MRNDDHNHTDDGDELCGSCGERVEDCNELEGRNDD